MNQYPTPDEQESILSLSHADPTCAAFTTRNISTPGYSGLEVGKLVTSKHSKRKAAELRSRCQATSLTALPREVRMQMSLRLAVPPWC